MEKAERSVLYLIAGQGADHRLFRDLAIETFRTVVLDFPLPEAGELLPAYAKRMAEQVDEAGRYSILGVSMGGMIAVEMAKYLKPERLILVSTAKTRKELPPHYRLMRWIPLYKLVSGKLLKRMANIGRRLFEPDSLPEEILFKNMISDKDPRYLKRTIHAIIHWKNNEVPENYVHIHGDRDRTLPIRWVKDVTRVAGGSHMMVLMRSEDVSRLVMEALDL